METITTLLGYTPSFDPYAWAFGSVVVLLLTILITAVGLWEKWIGPTMIGSFVAFCFLPNPPTLSGAAVATAIGMSYMLVAIKLMDRLRAGQPEQAERTTTIDDLFEFETIGGD